MTKYNCIDGKMVAFTEEEEAIIFGAPSNDELKSEMRSIRNGLLTETDWMASSDYTMSDEWKTYRQALRDLPSQSGFPDVDFPTKPS
tara:strand:- start:301 stop:561 length:261 start_codon:yes stop_codon:yes gene_type:complete